MQQNNTPNILDNAIYSTSELEFLHSLENGDYQKISPQESENQKEFYAQIAQNTLDKLSKKKVYSMRFVQNDIENIKILAMKKGMPYQTLISSIIHQVATKQIVI